MKVFQKISDENVNSEMLQVDKKKFAKLLKEVGFKENEKALKIRELEFAKNELVKKINELQLRIDYLNGSKIRKPRQKKVAD